MSDILTRCKVKPFMVLLLFSAALFLAACTSSKPKPGERPLGWLDAPTANATISGTVLMRGWAADENGIKSVCVSVDGGPASCAEDMGISRLDVGAALPTIPGSDRSGWEMQLDASKLSPGEHHLVFQATSKAGVTRDIGSVAVKVAQ
jgi:Bacterial Ig domain